MTTKRMYSLRVEKARKRIWQQAARESGLTLSEFIRKTCDQASQRRKDDVRLPR